MPDDPHDDPIESTPSALYDQGYVNAMSHFYRGELSRIMVWRQRLDTTTTWALTATTTIFTVSFTVRDVPHIIFVFNIAIVWMLLWIEARRYRFYDAFRARVRMLEAHFLVPMVMQNKDMLQGAWKKMVCEDLILPSFKISQFEAIGRRLKRNYAFLFIIIQIAWITKIFMHANPKITSWESFYNALGVSHIPAWLVAFFFVSSLAGVIGISAYIARRGSAEISEFGTNRSMWRI
ncbi:MAG: DUF2270 domain-containing protein [Verrucomicrobiota bacterium]